MARDYTTRQAAAICLILAFGTLAAYWPALSAGFVHYDDYDYVAHNWHVIEGLTWNGISWAFGSFYASNWHPLTWLSHMLDCQIFGLNPGGHHLTSVILHITNSTLLFGVLRSITGAFWRSAFVAALFALHPLHVESVAWVAERKDVLSVLFFLLTLWGYSRYAAARDSARSPATPLTDYQSRMTFFYLLTLMCFILGLMTKPMLVTLPFVLLLLDYWPLNRLGTHPTNSRLVLEKIPFFALSAVSSVVTLLAQRAGESVATLEQVPLSARLYNALVSYVWYAAKLLWPGHMSVVYPYQTWALSRTIGAGLLLLMITTLVLRARRQRPYLLFGWLWFVLTLIPVIGLLKVGNQAIADRYTYLPGIGFFVALTWGIAEVASSNLPVFTWLRSAAARAAVPGVSSLIVLLACGFVAHHQVGYWHNSETLLGHALAVTKDNFMAEGNLASYYAQNHKVESAVEHYRAAIKINPTFAVAWNGLGCALADEMKHEEAIECYTRALEIKPPFTDAQNNLGNSLYCLGKREQAIQCYLAVLEVDPQHALVHYNLGNALLDRGATAEAIGHFRSSLRSNPRYANARISLARALVKEEKLDEAAAEYRSALALEPQSVYARYGMGELLLEQGKRDAAVGLFSEVSKIQPERGPEAFNNLAWHLATHPNPAARDGQAAVKFAEQACKLTDYKEPLLVGTLAAACAEAGRFADAVAAAEKAKSLAEQSGQSEVAKRNGELLELYRAGKAYHEPR